MKPRTIAELGLVALVALAVAATTYVSQNRWSQAKVTEHHSFPASPRKARRSRAIELRQGDKKLALERKDQPGCWPTAEAIPPEPEAVRTLLVRLAEAQLVEPKTRKSDRFALLELEDAGAKDTKSREVRLLDQQGGLLAQAIIGKKRQDAFGSSKAGTYVRWPEDVQAWLANTDVEISAAVRDWVQPTLIDQDASKIKSVTVEIPNEAPLRIEREAGDAGKHKLVAIPDGKKLKQGGDVDAIRTRRGRPRSRRRPQARSGGSRRRQHRTLRDRQRPRRDLNPAPGRRGYLGLVKRARRRGGKKAADEINTRSKDFEFKIAPSEGHGDPKAPGRPVRGKLNARRGDGKVSPPRTTCAAGRSAPAPGLKWMRASRACRLARRLAAQRGARRSRARLCRQARPQSSPSHHSWRSDHELAAKGTARGHTRWGARARAPCLGPAHPGSRRARPRPAAEKASRSRLCREKIATRAIAGAGWPPPGARQTIPRTGRRASGSTLSAFELAGDLRHAAATDAQHNTTASGETSMKPRCGDLPYSPARR